MKRTTKKKSELKTTSKENVSKKGFKARDKKWPARRVISLILLIFFLPFAIWSLGTGAWLSFFIVAGLVYLTMNIIKKVWP